MRLYKYSIFIAGAFFAFGAMLAVLPLHAQESPLRQEERVRARVMQFKKMKLIEVLNMDDQMAEKFFVHYNIEQKKIEEARRSLEQTMRELNKAVDDQSPKMKELTDLTLKKHNEMQQAIGDMLRNMKQYLNDQQYARFLLFEARFQEEIRQILMDLKKQRRGERDDKEKE